MRRWVVVLALALGGGCGVGVPVSTPASPPAQEPEGLIDDEIYTTRIAGLRATLARHGVEIDTEPVIETCTADHVHERIPDHCVRCEVARRDKTDGVDPSLIDAVAIAFAAYPPSLIAAARLEHVALCRTIRFPGSPDERAPAGVAISDQHRLMISVEHFVDGAALSENFSITQVVHHEVFHLFDRATGPGVETDREWDAINPPGFVYQDPAATEPKRPAGFVNSYATTNAREDRATVFEFLLGQPTKLCEIANVDPAVAAKTRLVWKRVAKVVGAKLLRQHAACVESIGKKPRKKPKRPVTLQLPRR
jgi:hypothetical protein